MHMSLSPTIVARKQIEASNAGKTLWRSKWGSFAAAFCRDQCWIGIDVGTGRDRLGQISWRQGNEIPSETSTSSEVAKRWLLGNLSKLQIKLIILVKPLICALNPALNLDKPLTASRLVIKALSWWRRPQSCMIWATQDLTSRWISHTSFSGCVCRIISFKISRLLISAWRAFRWLIGKTICKAHIVAK